MSRGGEVEDGGEGEGRNEGGDENGDAMTLVTNLAQSRSRASWGEGEGEPCVPSFLHARCRVGEGEVRWRKGEGDCVHCAIVSVGWVWAWQIAISALRCMR